MFVELEDDDDDDSRTLFFPFFSPTLALIWKKLLWKLIEWEEKKRQSSVTFHSILLLHIFLCAFLFWVVDRNGRIISIHNPS